MGKHHAPEPVFTWLDRDDGLRSPTGNCWGFEDGLDGFEIHDPRCPNVGKGWIGGSSCIDHKNWRGRHPDWARR